MIKKTFKAVIIENEYGNSKKTYKVKFICNTFINFFIFKFVKKSYNIDKCIFYNIYDAEKYAQIMEKQAKIQKIAYTDYEVIDNEYCDIIQVFPHNYKKLEKLNLFAIMYTHNNEIYIGIIDTNNFNGVIEQNDFYRQLKQKYIDTRILKYNTKLNELTENYVECVLQNYIYTSTPIKSYSKYNLKSIEDDEEVNELDNSRQKIIEKEIERIDKYKEFLLGFK